MRTALFERAQGHLAGCDVDAVQMEAYDLALCWAELRAAGVALDALAAASSHETASAGTQWKDSAFERQLAGSLLRRDYCELAQPAWGAASGVRLGRGGARRSAFRRSRLVAGHALRHRPRPCASVKAVCRRTASTATMR